MEKRFVDGRIYLELRRLFVPLVPRGITTGKNRKRQDDFWIVGFKRPSEDIRS